MHRERSPPQEAMEKQTDAKGLAKAEQQRTQARRRQRRAVVSPDSDGADGSALSWWATTLVCGVTSSPPPFMASSLAAAARNIVSAPAAHSVLLTPYQVYSMGLVPSSQLPDSKSASVPGTPPMFSGAVAVVHFSDEYVYRVADLADLSDKAFRKSCRRMSAVLRRPGSGLRVETYTAATVDKALIGRCMRCRNTWEQLRAANRTIKEATAPGVRRRPPPRRNYYLSALLSRRLRGDGNPDPSMTLFVITRAIEAEECSTDHPDNTCASERHNGLAMGPVLGYLICERVGHTLVSVDGVHDYSIDDPRADPSAWLLHVACQWWLSEDGGLHPELGWHEPPMWLNDGPVPTPGLLQYKSKYHGMLQPLYKVYGKSQE